MSTQRLTKTFIDYVSVGSETGNELDFCLKLEQELVETGFEVERSEMGQFCNSNGFNIHGWLPGEGESILPCCHTDTVGCCHQGYVRLQRDYPGAAEHYNPCRMRTAV